MFSLQVDPNITLKLPTLKNAPELFAVIDRNRPYLRKHLYWVDHAVSVENSKTFIKESRQQFKKQAGFALCIFYYQKIIGTISLQYIDKEDFKTEIGYWLSEDQQGKSIMRKSCQALITYCFDILKLHRIEIRCALTNVASQHIPEKLGFTQEGILREAAFINGQFHDLFLYSLLSSEFHT